MFSLLLSPQQVRARLIAVYGGEVDKIDVWVGGLLESVEGEAQLGPTFSCLIANQFRRLRTSDR